MISTTEDNILELRNVSFHYPDGSVGLDGCSLSLRRGSRTVLLGPNGAGKTTLFLHMNGILRPGNGQVLFNGSPLDYARQGLRELRSKVGLVFQNPDSQLFSASVREDVSFGPMNMGLERREVRERVEQALEAVGMTSCADKPVHNLSYGQKKRVCIAGVLAMRPQVMILDEPTAGLDLRMQRELLEVLHRLHCQGITIVMATHDVDLAYVWADEACLLDRGRLAKRFSAECFPQQTGVLEQHGLGVPQVALIHPLLVERGVLSAGGAAPRSCTELARMLETDLNERT
ncbi:energy-coupling factor ABC transporter ATP-binding protein [Geobacter sp. SVR]|uniref:energy-coupling factor ABC transporter ATP-binding protein n=1 Tax=Geobacter sp. SVR TaxID=2495594 RepID=UPI00143EFB3E|nr:ATP-binding cassette domain-containing protein [Geobacter sp. SVR]BCS53196.1 energy-coupling factor ABC transporter ATP-binding protein [Geobacter sp. SVR]GCF84581.1 energy-coupling factor ABC transporter ATP-binding protein [Geobacter sp. SVR]